jgi:hypothetical protein
MPMKSSSNVHKSEIYQEQESIMSRASAVLWHLIRAVIFPRLPLHLT